MAPAESHRWVFACGEGEKGSSLKKSMKKWFKALKRRVHVELVALEHMLWDDMRKGDVICLLPESACVIDPWIGALTTFVRSQCGSLLILNGDEDGITPFNKLLQNFAMKIENHAVMNMAMHKEIYHPRHLILRNPDLSTLPESPLISSLLLPHALTLQLHRPSQPVLKSSAVCCPPDQPIGKFLLTDDVTADVSSVGGGWDQDGKVLVLSCHSIVLDKWSEVNGNKAFLDTLVSWLISDQKLKLQQQSRCSSSNRMLHRPDIHSLAQMPRQCPGFLSSASSLEFDASLASLSLEHVGRVSALASELGIQQTNLSLIAPQFVLPPPILHPATFPIQGPPLIPPPIELFDLDDEHRDKHQRLDISFHKSANDISFIEQSGQICGIKGHSPHEILIKAFLQIAEYKR